MESSFFYGYLVTQIPAGFLAAKYPPNKLFGVAIGVASFLNVLLPHGFNSKSDTLVAIIQILQGLGVAYPSMHGVWRYWAPPLERSKLATTAFTGSYAGAVLGLPVSAFLVSYVGWSAPFYLYGFIGCVWAIFWFSLTFEKPAFHPTITQEEKTYIEDAIGHVSNTHPTSGILAALPHAVMGLVVLAGGQLADYLRSNKYLSTTAVRKLFNCGGFGGEALFLLIVAYTKKESTAVIALILAVGSSGFAISGFNVNHLDIAPRYAAILMGFSNGIGTLAGLTCPIVTEKFTANGAHGWVKVFLLASLIHFTGVTFYAIYASGELQDWAEPKPEEEAWSATALNHINSNAGYGTAKNEESTNMTALPIAVQPNKRSSQSTTNSANPLGMEPSNPFVSGWDDENTRSTPYKQNW
ncbi:transporter, major facilitator family protein [Dictyocaulus viviparus]|uniref:Transporter, major facilitator family protein n=1 Tax=Dictyocaulus viviparus TaxID=29172 RepID=A0A0D8X9B6_DICVI|nr:transporter, major facilitator family protein [Dictyocaulus viviparus]